MKRSDFLRAIEAGFQKNLDILKAKNADYAQDDNAFLNFSLSEALGIPTEKAIIVRLSDKLSRIATLVSKPAEVKDETIFDTLSDLANYAMILKVFLEFKAQKNEEKSPSP